MDEEETALRDCLRVCQDNYKFSKEDYDWSYKHLNKIINSTKDSKEKEEAYKCLMSSEENLSIIAQSMSQSQKHLDEYLAKQNPEQESQKSKQVWKSLTKDSTGSTNNN